MITLVGNDFTIIIEIVFYYNFPLDELTNHDIIKQRVEFSIIFQLGHRVVIRLCYNYAMQRVTNSLLTRGPT